MYIVIENLFFNNSQLSVYENFLNEKTNGIKNFNLLQLIKHYFDTNALKTNFGKKDFSKYSIPFVLIICFLVI